MLLAIDIGNTNIVLGCIQDDEILFQARIATDRLRTSDQYGVEIKNMLEALGVQREDITDCIIASVVPPVFNSVRTGVRKIIGKQPMVVGPGLKTGLNIRVDVPGQVGSDRIVIAVAALAEYEAPLILMDLGTATTIEVVEAPRTYLGGVIYPGVRLSLEALTNRAAQLPGISLDKPKRVIGKNTVDCMRSGMMYGTAAMIDGVVERMEEELGFHATLIATGGMAQFITPLCKREIVLEKDLLLKGLNIHTDVPSQVGSDRIVIAVAALAEYKAPLILIDMGTATTIEVVEPDNLYMGGVIFPGVMVSLDALTSRAAQLPGISLDKPDHVVGKNTVDCMRSGMMYGTAAMIDGLIERIEEELGHSSTIIATGGLARFITPLCKRKIINQNDLLLKGLNIIYKKNKRV